MLDMNCWLVAFVCYATVRLIIKVCELAYEKGAAGSGRSGMIGCWLAGRGERMLVPA